MSTVIKELDESFFCTESEANKILDQLKSVMVKLNDTLLNTGCKNLELKIRRFPTGDKQGLFSCEIYVDDTIKSIHTFFNKNGESLSKLHKCENEEYFGSGNPLYHETLGEFEKYITTRLICMGGKQ